MPGRWSAGLALIAGIFCGTAAQAQDAVAGFYRGKNIQMVIGSSPGGGYDLYGRLVARHMGKYIPGQPNVVASNMSGAGSIVATQHIAIAAPKDGTVIGAIFPGALVEQLVGDKGKIKYDARKLSFIGSANNELYVCIVRADAGVTDFPDFLKRNVLIGASAAGGSTRDFPLLLNNLFGANFKIVSGYPGSNEILLAIEKGEVQGTCGVGWSTVSVQRSQWLRDGFIKIVAQEGMRSAAELDKQGVPLAYSFAKTPRDQQVMQVHYEPLSFGRPFIAAAEVPADRIEALQAAFMKAMEDPDLRSEAERLRLDIAPASGKEVAAIVNKIYDLPQEIIDAARAAIGSK
jgi:tripartite-type tricarboxylate transporter receptor subunit TctC